MENPIKMDDLGVPLFLETPMCPWLAFDYWKDHSRNTQILTSLRRRIVWHLVETTDGKSHQQT